MTSNRDILITGGSGMLATAFKQLLPDATFTDRSTLDITDGIRSRNQLLQTRPRIVINCAAYTKVDQAEVEHGAAERVNAVAVTGLASTCGEINAKLVHFSTDYVFDGSLTRPLRPDDPVGPKSFYGRSKWLGEQEIRRRPHLKDWLIIRTAWLYGHGGPNFPNTMINAARAGKPLRVIDDQIGTPTYTMDLAAATLNLLNVNASGIFHFANAGQTNWREFAIETLRIAGIDHEVAATTSAQWKADRPTSADRPSYSVLDTSAYSAATGQPVRPWQDALRDYLTHHPTLAK